MKITPVDIQHKTFNTQMFGLNKEEVHQYIQDISRELEGLLIERNQMKEALREKDISVMEYKERDKVLNETISTAAKMAEKLREDAEKEANNIRKEAEIQAQGIIHETREQLKNMYREIMDLKKLRVQFETNMKALATAHIEVLEKYNFNNEGITVQNPVPNESRA